MYKSEWIFVFEFESTMYYKKESKDNRGGQHLKSQNDFVVIAILFYLIYSLHAYLLHFTVI